MLSQGYYDNRYWTLWKLPMFGCTDPGAVLQEVNRATKAFPNAYIRLVRALAVAVRGAVWDKVMQTKASAVFSASLPLRLP